MSLGGLKGKLGPKAAPAQKEAKRPRLALGDEEEDDSNKQQEITGWDTAEGGAVDAAGKKKKDAPRVIPALPNRDWRDDARRRQLAKAPHTQAQNVLVTEPADAPKMEYGLTILKKEDSQANGADESGAPDAPAEPMEDVKDTMTDEQRLEKKALDALVNGKSTDDDLVIPLYNEDESFRNDLRNAPEAPTLDAYAATPIEGFGAALLRGMGWKDGEAVGKNGAPAKPKEIKRRPALLGIGAKESAATGVEVGDFKGGRGKGKKEAQSFNPVALRNKHTGEMLTEEELKAKIEQQNMVQEEPKKERRKYSDDEDDGERRREKRREKDDRHRDRRRDDEYDSERRRGKDYKDDRRREKDDYDDSDRRRDKRKDKYKDDEYDSERRREKRRDRGDDYDSERRREKRRERSRSPDNDRRDKKRDRYRSRSRDSKRDRDRRDRSRESDDRRKRRREYDDERDDRKRRH